jgi:Amt family ammonium transporter
VAITSPCAFVSPVSAFIIGAVAGVLVVVSVFFFDKIKIDDPVVPSASTARTAPGASSRSASSRRQLRRGLERRRRDRVPGRRRQGRQRPHRGDHTQIVAQIVEVVAGEGWNILVGGLAFYIIGKVLGSNRVPAEVEIAGLDVPEMGMAGYPEFVETIAAGVRAQGRGRRGQGQRGRARQHARPSTQHHLPGLGSPVPRGPAEPRLFLR